MGREVADRCRDIIDAIDKCFEYIEHLRGPNSGMAFDAIVRNLTVIGEAAKYIPEEDRSRHPDTPWRDVTGMRDIAAHQYFRIRRDVADHTVRNELPSLRAVVLRIASDY